LIEQLHLLARFTGNVEGIGNHKHGGEFSLEIFVKKFLGGLVIINKAAGVSQRIISLGPFF